MEVYGDIKSGNCYKIKLICALLDIEHKWIHVDILADEGGFDLSLYRAIQSWVGRIKSHPRYIGMEE